MTNRRRNPQRFTTDESVAATVLATEGGTWCHTSTIVIKGKSYTHRYPRIGAAMCDIEPIQTLARVMGTKVRKRRFKNIVCDPQIYEEPYTEYYTTKTGKTVHKTITRLKPLLPKGWLKKHQRTIEKCT